MQPRASGAGTRRGPREARPRWSAKRRPGYASPKQSQALKGRQNAARGLHVPACRSPSLALETTMPTEREKMLAGELYDPLDAELVAARSRARDLCWELNATRDSQQEERRRIL